MFKMFNNVIIKLHHSKLQISLRIRVLVLVRTILALCLYH